MNTDDDAGEFTCHSCGRRYRWQPKLAGRKIQCKCDQFIRVPVDPHSPSPSAGDRDCCPGCGKPVKPGAVICIACGYNFKTGEKLQTSIQADTTAATTRKLPPYTSYDAAGQKPSMPDTHLAGAILVTLFCCMPFGIVAIVNAAKVNEAYAAGKFDQAVDYSKKAGKWINWGIVSGLLGAVLYMVGGFLIR